MAERSTELKYTAIVLAGGAGKRMNAKVHKQYLPIGGKPVLYYSLKAFEESEADSIVLVTGAGEIEYCRQEIIETYGLKKIVAIVEGGRERYHSVYEGLKAASGADYVMIHDGARPFLTQEMIARSMKGVQTYQACVLGMPVKDTIKIADENCFAQETPKRSSVWMIQTPQSFSYPLIYDAYEKLIQKGRDATDDAMVLECMTGQKVRLLEGSYQNIKITTPEDLITAEAWLKHMTE